MLKEKLIATMERAENPYVIRATAWALEQVTGVKTADLLRKSYQEYNVNSGTHGQNWYEENGYPRLASLYGGGFRSHSGKAVAVESALEFGAVYACVKIISQDIGNCPFFLHERAEDGEKVEKAYGHPTFRVLHDQPNADMSSGEFREALTAQALLGVDGFAAIIRDNSEQVIGMWPYAVGAARVDRDSRGRKVFLIKEGNSPEKTQSAYDTFHLKAFTLDGQKGDDILKRARHAIGLGLSADEYAASFFGKDATPGVIMSVPVEIKYTKEKVQEIKDVWVGRHGGVSNAHKLAVLSDGVTMSRLDPNFQQLQLTETRENQIVEVAMMYQMPLHKLAQLKRSTNNNIEHQGLEYEQQTLRSWFRRWQDAAERCLLTTEERYWSTGRPRMFVEFNVEALVRGNSTAQSAGFAAGLLNGYYSINEIRGFLNMNPIGPAGDEHRVQMQMQDVAQAAESALAGATQGEPKQ